MKKPIHCAAVAGISLWLLGACAPTQNVSPLATPQPTQGQSENAATLAPIHLRVGTLKYMSNGPVFIAREQGFFAEQGLDVELVDFGYVDRDMLPALLDSQLDIAATSINAGILNAIANGGNLRLVADKGHVNPDACATEAWLARKSLVENGDLADLSGLKGRTMATWIGTTFEYANDMLLAKAGLTDKDVQITTVADATARIDALRSGTIDVSTEAEPWITHSTEQDASALWLPLSAIVPDLSVAAIVYGPGILDENPQAGVRFMAAYLKAVRHFSAGKSDQSVQIIAKYTGLAPDVIRSACWNSYHADGSIDEQQLMNFVTWTHGKGYLDSLLRLPQIWDPQFVEQAKGMVGE